MLQQHRVVFIMLQISISWLILKWLCFPLQGLVFTPQNGQLVALLNSQLFKYTGWAKKTGLFFRLDNFVTVSPRKACSMSKFSKFYREKKVRNSHFNEFKYSLSNLLKSSQQLKLCYI